MKIPLPLYLTLPLGLLLIFSTAAPVKGQQPLQSNWEKTVQAAREEGQVNIYGGDEITHPGILEVFSRRFPEIKVVTASGHAEVIQRIIAERRARKFLADLYSLGPGSARTAYRAKFLQPIRPALILPEVTDTSLWYGGKHVYPDPDGEYLFLYEGTPASSSVGYNTEKLTDLNEIKSYWDILKPKWKGKIGFYSYGSAPTPILVLYYNPQVGPNFLKRLFEEMDLTLSRDRRQATNWLATGKYSLCFMCRDLERARRQGLPVDGYPYENIKEAGAMGGGNGSVLAFLNHARTRTPQRSLSIGFSHGKDNQPGSVS